MSGPSDRVSAALPPSEARSVLEEPARPPLAEEDGAWLVGAALESLRVHLAGGGDGAPAAPPASLLERAPLFVSVYARGELRGCLGTLDPTVALCEAVRELAVAAAARDPRFHPLSARDLPGVGVEVSVLGSLLRIEGDPDARLAALRPGEHGLLVRLGQRSGILLPQVPQRWGWDARRFLSETCRKAGLPEGAWKELATEVRIFRCAVFRGGGAEGQAGEAGG